MVTRLALISRSDVTVNSTANTVTTKNQAFVQEVRLITGIKTLVPLILFCLHILLQDSFF